MLSFPVNVSSVPEQIGTMYRGYKVRISEGDSRGAIFRTDYLRGDSCDLAKYGNTIF